MNRKLVTLLLIPLQAVLSIIELANTPEQWKIGDPPPDSLTSNPEYSKENVEQKPKEFMEPTQESHDV